MPSRLTPLHNNRDGIQVSAIELGKIKPLKEIGDVMAAIPTKAIKIFYSYAHEDERLRKALDKQLSLLRRDGLITSWYDHKISPGKEWGSEIDAQLNSAEIILLLISPDFIASDYCYSIEMKRAMERHELGEARVIPVILRPADWKRAPFGKLKSLPSDGKAVTRWSNRDEAFLNVAKGIRRAVKELTPPPILPPQPSISPPSSNNTLQVNPEVSTAIWNIPYRRNPFFTGREEILAQLYDTFREGKARSLKLPLALSGLGGVGKTQTAIEYAYRYRAEYETVLWVRAESRDVLISDYLTIAELLKPSGREVKDQSLVVDGVKDWLNEHTGWLLILDNVEDLEMISNFLPTETKEHILLTTRAQATSGITQRVKVETLEPEEGALLLLRRANMLAQGALLDEVSDMDLTKAEEISHSMGGLPLGLDQAGAYIEETGLGLTGYLELYQTQQQELLKRRGRQITGHPEPVTATWTLSFEKVQQANAAAADLLQLCAFLYPDAIPEELLSASIADLSPSLHSIATNPIKLNEAIEALLKFSLVRRDPHTGALTIHRLVQAALKDEMNEDTQRQWAKGAVQFVNRAFPDVEFTTWSRCQQYLPHALVCKALIEEWDMAFPEAAQLLYKIGHYLWERAQLTQAEPVLQRALAIRENVLGLEDPDVAQTLNLLGAVYTDEDKYAQAEPVLQRALAIREKVLGQDDLKVAESLNDLGGLYLYEGKFMQAEALLQRAVIIREKMLGREHPDTARSLSNLGLTYSSQGKKTQAEQIARQVLAIHEKLYGREHPDVAFSLSNLAPQLDNTSEAEQLLRQALAIREKLLGREHPDVASSLNNLAGRLAEQGKYPQAKAFAQRSLTIREKVLGPKHHEVANSLNTLGSIYLDQHNCRKAEPLLQRALAIREKVLGLEHPDVAWSLVNLGRLYFEEGKYAKAEPLYQRALAIYENVFGSEYPHPTLVHVLYNYARLLQQTKRKPEAAELVIRAKELQTKYTQANYN